MSCSTSSSLPIIKNQINQFPYKMKVDGVQFDFAGRTVEFIIGLASCEQWEFGREGVLFYKSITVPTGTPIDTMLFTMSKTESNEFDGGAQYKYRVITSNGANQPIITDLLPVLVKL